MPPCSPACGGGSAAGHAAKDQPPTLLPLHYRRFSGDYLQAWTFIGAFEHLQRKPCSCCVRLCSPIPPFDRWQSIIPSARFTSSQVRCIASSRRKPEDARNQIESQVSCSPFSRSQPSISCRPWGVGATSRQCRISFSLV